MPMMFDVWVPEEEQPVTTQAQPTESQEYKDLQAQLAQIQSQLKKQQSIDDWLNQSKPFQPTQYNQQANPWINSFNYQSKPFAFPSGVGVQNSLAGQNQVNYGSGLLGANQYAQSQGAK